MNRDLAKKLFREFLHGMLEQCDSTDSADGNGRQRPKPHRAPLPAHCADRGIQSDTTEVEPNMEAATRWASAPGRTGGGGGGARVAPRSEGRPETCASGSRFVQAATQTAAVPVARRARLSSNGAMSACWMNSPRLVREVQRSHDARGAKPEVLVRRLDARSLRLDAAEAVRCDGHSPLVVVAIDFGTTYSGYAFSFVRQPEDVFMMRQWEGEDVGIANAKIPTALLLRADGEFHSFGRSARDFYHDLPAHEARQWLYFDKFKMMLHQQQLAKTTPIAAANGQTQPAVAVFRHALRYFKEHALRELSDQTGMSIQNDDIRWVITVPAIWRPSAKQRKRFAFPIDSTGLSEPSVLALVMREAACEAGIGCRTAPERTLISLEPEAASLYCRQLKHNQMVPERPLELHLTPPSSPTRPNPSKPWLSLSGKPQTTGFILEPRSGKKYMIVDCGGGTVDITVHQVIDHHGHCIKELHRASGGPFGSIGVDLAFEAFLASIFGADFMGHFKARLPSAHVDLMVAFEARKRQASPFRCTAVNIALPFSFIDSYRKYSGKEVEKAISKYGDPHIRWSAQGMLRLDQNVMAALFQPTIDGIIQHIGEILSVPDLCGVAFLCLVGGFAESHLLQLAVRSHFARNVIVIIPQEVSLVTLKGAVLFGMNPKSIAIRRTPLTYGVAVLNPFIQGRHPVEKLVIKDGVAYARDVMDVFVTCDQSVCLGEKVVRSYSPARRHQKRIVLNVYCCETDHVQFVTDPGVQHCATLSLTLTPTADQSGVRSAERAKIRTRRLIRVTMEFGDTEIRASALDVAAGNLIQASFDFLADPNTVNDV